MVRHKEIALISATKKLVVATCDDLLQLRKNIYIEVSIGKDKQPMQ
jgi:hypothetical protein